MMSLRTLLLVGLGATAFMGTRPAIAQPPAHSGHGHSSGSTRIELTRQNGRFVLQLGTGSSRGGYSPLRGGGYSYAPASTYVAPPVPSGFGSYSHVDDLASELESLMNDVCLDMYYNYRHNPGFRTTYAEAYQLFEVARYVHEHEHHGHRSELRRRLGGMDALFHHIEEDVHGWHAHPHVRVGRGDLFTKLAKVEDVLHHLMEDVGVAGTPGLTVAPPPSSLGATPPSPVLLPRR